MRVAAVLENDIRAGGGFNQALSAIQQMSRLCSSAHEFVVFTSMSENLEFLERLGVEAHLFSFSWVDRWLSFSATDSILRRLQDALHWQGKLEKTLVSDDIDLVYFVTPTARCLALQKLNYIATVWDLCHRDCPEFPEVRQFNEFLRREQRYQSTLPQALAVIADSDSLVDVISRCYGVERERLIAMPFSPAPLIDTPGATATDTVMERYGLSPGYFFYPAQFWPHKNHIRILQAMALLQERGVEVTAVFCGGDRGNMESVRQSSRKLGVDDKTRFLGFVPPSHMRGLYQACAAVVMPSYFGPTNLPPLEAWSLEKPLVYSSTLADEAGDAALFADPDSAASLAEALEKVLDVEVVADLVRRGAEQLAAMDRKRERAEEALLAVLDRFSTRLECWKE